MNKTIISMFALCATMLISCNQPSNDKAGKDEPVKKENKAEAKAEKTLKVAWVQLDSIQNNYEYYKTVQKQLEDKQASAEAQMNAKGKSFANQYQSLQERAQAGQLTQQQYEKEVTRLQQAQANLQQLEAKLSVQLQEEAVNQQRALVDTIRAQVKKYAKEKGYDFVLCQNSDINNVLFASEVYEITDEIVALLNKHYKAEAKEDKKEEKKDDKKTEKK